MSSNGAVEENGGTLPPRSRKRSALLTAMMTDDDDSSSESSQGREKRRRVEQGAEEMAVDTGDPHNMTCRCGLTFDDEQTFDDHAHTCTDLLEMLVAQDKTNALREVSGKGVKRPAMVQKAFDAAKRGDNFIASHRAGTMLLPKIHQDTPQALHAALCETIDALANHEFAGDFVQIDRLAGPFDEPRANNDKLTPGTTEEADMDEIKPVTESKRGRRGRPTVTPKSVIRKRGVVMRHSDLAFIRALIEAKRVGSTLELRRELQALRCSALFLYGPYSERYARAKVLTRDVGLITVSEVEKAARLEADLPALSPEIEALGSQPFLDLHTSTANSLKGPSAKANDPPPSHDSILEAFAKLAADAEATEQSRHAQQLSAERASQPAAVHEPLWATLLASSIRPPVGSRTVKADLSAALELLPELPAELADENGAASASREVLLEYARAAQRALQCYESRERDLVAAASDRETRVDSLQRELRFAYQELDARSGVLPGEPALSSRLAARATSHGSTQALMVRRTAPNNDGERRSFSAHDLERNGDAATLRRMRGEGDDGELRASTTGGEPHEGSVGGGESATLGAGLSLPEDDETLTQVADELVGVPYLLAGEVRLWCAMRRHFERFETATLGDVRQWIGAQRFGSQMPSSSSSSSSNQRGSQSTAGDDADGADGSGAPLVRKGPPSVVLSAANDASESERPLTFEQACDFVCILLRQRVLTTDEFQRLRMVPADRETAATRRIRPSGREWSLLADQLRTMSMSAADVRTCRAYKPRSEEVYGEANPIFVNQLIRRLDITAEDTFVDLGSGIGTIALQVAALTGCRAKGVEIRAELHEIASKFQTTLVDLCAQRGWTGIGEVELRCGDATRLPELELLEEHRVKLGEATVVFCNNYVFSAQLEDQIFRMLADCLQRGCKVVVMKPYCPRFRPGSERFSNHPLHSFKYPYVVESTPREAVSWTANAVSYFVYTYEPTLTSVRSDAPPPPKAEFSSIAAPR